MKLLDKILLKRYIGKDPDEYFLAKDLSFILLFTWVLMAFLSLLSFSNHNIDIDVVHIFIVINISLVLLLFGKIKIATLVMLFGINITTSILVFTPIAGFDVNGVYKLAFFQLVIMCLSALITYKQFYAYLMMISGTVLIVFHFFYSGLKLNRALVLASYSDYVAALVLLFISGFIIIKVISQKNRNYDKLKNSEEKYSTVVNSGSEGIVIHQKGLIKFVNGAAARLSGSEQSELLNKPITNFVQIDQKQMTQERMEARMAGGDISELLDIKLIHKDGSALDVEVKRTDIIFQGEKSILLFLRDITQRKKLQETLIQSEKMLSLGGLAAGMAHEINNPLAGIMQNAQVISNRLEKDSPENIKAAEYLGLDLAAMRTFLKERKIFNQLGRIQEAGIRAAEIVSNMLGFARKEQSKSSHDIRELLNKTVEMAGSDYNLKKKYDFRSIKVVRDYEENLPLVCCNQGQLQQVFFNLLKNGAEAMHDPSTNSGTTEAKELASEEAQFTLSMKKKGKIVRIEIQNNLTGIPAKLQGRIFEPFYTTKPVGTGLGLSVSYFIIHETHGGELRVESDGESWVKFIIEIPIN